MAILEVFPDESYAWDVCVVGCGSVGIALALECEMLGLSVLILEAGGSEPDLTKPAIDAEIIDPACHAPLHLASASAFGGTSWLWGGRCVPFDPFDFRKRPHIAESGWPIDHQDVAPYYAQAADYLGCGNADFKKMLNSWHSSRDLLTVDHIERWSSEPRRAIPYRDRIKNSKLLTVSLRSPVVEIDLDQSGERVRSVIVAGPQKRHRFHANYVVLAAGGLATTRLMLLTQRKWPRHFGGRDGALGRYYMGHLTGQVSFVNFSDPSEIEHFDYQLDETHHYVMRRFALREHVQANGEMLNCAFWLENPPFRDPAHRNGLLSLIFLSLMIPALGRSIVSEPIRLASIGRSPARVAEHIRNVAVQPHRTFLDALQILRDRLTPGPSKPSFLYRNTSGTYALRYHAEQGANRENRISLGERANSLGLPSLIIKFGFSEGDAQSIIRSHEILDGALQASGKGKLLYHCPREARVQRVLDQATDGYHQIGTTRMGTDKRTSVVDRNCRVHDVSNLFIASSSVFVTSSQANPTLLAATLAVRLAHQIASVTPRR